MTAWPLVSLSDLLALERRPVRIEADQQYAEIGIYCFGRGIFHKPPRSGVEVGEKDLYLIRQDDFILQITFAWEGAIALASEADDGMYASTRFPTFRVDYKRCVPQFLLNYFRTAEGRNQLVKVSPGSAGRNRVLSIKRLSEVVVPLPPIEEQRRIVRRIEIVSTRIRDAEQLVSESDQLTHSLMPSLIETRLGSKEWAMETVDQLVGRANLRNGLSLKSDGLESSIRCLRLSAMRDGLIDCSDSKPIALSVTEASQYLVHQSDVFIVRGNGSKQLVGQAGRVKNHLSGTIFPDLFIRVPLDADRMLPAFFVAWWNSPVMRDRIEAVAKTTSGIWKINQGHIASFSVPVPPIADQRAVLQDIEGHASRAEGLHRLRSASRNELRAVLPSLLNFAFSGRL